jgi:hypothetical protein
LSDGLGTLLDDDGLLLDDDRLATVAPRPIIICGRSHCKTTKNSKSHSESHAAVVVVSAPAIVVAVVEDATVVA